jgi:hypothetical protein
MTTTLLSAEALRKLSAGSGASYFFDFSAIHAGQYEVLFPTLQRFALRDVDAIGFSCDTLASRQSGDALPEAVLSSIAHTKTHFVRNIVELLCFLISKSARLASVHFSHLTVTLEQLERLSKAFGKSRVLRELHFSNVELRDEGASVILRHLNPDTIESVEMVKCGLTKGAVNDILMFISRRTTVGVGLRAFDVSPTEIPDADRWRISIAVSGRPRSTSPTDARSATEEEDSGDSELDVEAISRQEQITQLQAENKLLMDDIKAFKEMADAVAMSDSVFIVGPGAPDFLLYLNRVEARLAEANSRQKL